MGASNSENPKKFILLDRDLLVLDFRLGGAHHDVGDAVACAALRGRIDWARFDKLLSACNVLKLFVSYL